MQDLVARAIDDAHATLSDLRSDAVVAEQFIDHLSDASSDCLRAASGCLRWADLSSGILRWTRVPLPGPLARRNSPPSLSTRSRIPINPKWPHLTSRPQQAESRSRRPRYRRTTAHR